MRLQFLVQGSSPKPYRVTAEGVGRDLRMFCTCPAGSRANVFCKHVAAMLMGDVTKLVQPSDSVADLQVQAKGSPLLAQALAHVPVSEQKRRVEGFDDLQQVFAAYESVVAEAGCEMRFRTEDVDGYAEHLEVFGFTPTGRRSKRVTLSLSYFTTAFDVLFDEDGKIYHANHRPRARPWTVRKGGVPTSRKELATSLPDFLDGVEELVQRSRRTE